MTSPSDIDDSLYPNWSRFRSLPADQDVSSLSHEQLLAQYRLALAAFDDERNYLKSKLTCPVTGNGLHNEHLVPVRKSLIWNHGNGVCFVTPKVLGRARGSNKGNCVVAVDHIAKDEVLAVWGGRVCDFAELQILPARERMYSVQVEEDMYLVTDINEVGPADWINHSCDPNAGLRGQIVVVALRDIEKGEEICYDYAMTDACAYDEFDCCCQTKYCRQQVSANDWQLAELQERYRGYFAPHVQRKIDSLPQPATDP